MKNSIIAFFSENYEWIFSGIGIFVISFILKCLKHNAHNSTKYKLIQKNSNKSNGTQIGSQTHYYKGGDSHDHKANNNATR